MSVVSCFQRFDLVGLLPAGQHLAINLERGIVTMLADGAIVGQEMLSGLEISLALQILEAWPEWCPNEVLLAAYRHSSVDQARSLMLEALERGTFEELMHQPRNVLWRCRVKLERLGITIEARYRLGYQLS